VIKAVVLDLDGVYFENDTKVFIDKLKNTFDLTENQIKEVYFKSSQMSDYKSGKIDGKQFWDWAIKTWEIQTDMDIIIKMLLSSYSVKPEVQDYVKKLRNKGLKTAICTNNFPERLNGLKQEFKLDLFFDVIITSFEIGVTKPNKEIFDKLSDALSCTPCEIIMSDDRDDNIKTLQKLGFKALRYTNWKTFVSEVGKLIG